MSLSNATIASNLVDGDRNGDGMDNLHAAVSVKTTILVQNQQEGFVFHNYDCDGPFTSLGHNMIQNPADCTVTQTTGNLFNAVQLLGPLQYNGGATQTYALLSTSQAIDAGDNNSCGSTDECGLRRPVNGGVSLRCDIGAFEFHPFGLFVPLIRR